MERADRDWLLLKRPDHGPLKQLRIVLLSVTFNVIVA